MREGLERVLPTKARKTFPPKEDKDPLRFTCVASGALELFTFVHFLSEVKITQHKNNCSKMHTFVALVYS